MYRHHLCLFLWGLWEKWRCAETLLHEHRTDGESENHILFFTVVLEWVSNLEIILLYFFSNSCFQFFCLEICLGGGRREARGSQAHSNECSSRVNYDVTTGNTKGWKNQSLVQKLNTCYALFWDLVGTKPSRGSCVVKRKAHKFCSLHEEQHSPYL